MAKIVVLGGGTGLSVILRGLKKVFNDITAIVTVADDGGGSGVLREDLGMLPPGDIRSCLLALSNKEPLLQELFQYRFHEGRLKGQNFGNLMIAAMMGISDNFEEALKKISDILKITGEVLPVASEPAVLIAELENGAIIRGESNIPYAVVKKKSPIKKVWLEKEMDASDVVIQKIKDADSIIIGPGSLYTSVISTLKVGKIVDAINHSRGRVFYVTNIMTQLGETDGFTPADHLYTLVEQTALKRLNYVLINTKMFTKDEIGKYREERADQSLLTSGIQNQITEYLNKSFDGAKIVTGNFAIINKGYIVHDAEEIANQIMEKTQTLYTDTCDKHKN